MKKAIQVTEVDGEGLMALLNERVIIICVGYFYAGMLAGVNDVDVMLEDASIVFDAGDWTKNKNGKFQTQEKLGRTLYVRTSSIESYMAE